MKSLDELGPAGWAALLTTGCLGFIVLIVLATIFNGFVLMYLWAWFVVVPFGLPALSIGQSLGLSGLISFITYQHVDCQPVKESGGVKIANAIVLTFMRPLIALVVGRIIFYFTYGR